MVMQMITIFRALQPMDAHLVRSRLEAAGFHAIVSQELSALSIEGYALGAGGILVQVPDDEAAEANEFLAAPDQPEDEGSEPVKGAE